MPANADWIRWIRASVGDYLKAATNLPTIIEELDDRSEAFMHSPIRAEIRINGPFTREISNDCHRCWVDANVLVTSRRKGYDHLRYLGLFHAAMDAGIPLFRYGDGNSPLGCLRLRDAVRVLSFGQLDRTDSLLQNAVDAKYVAYLSL